MLEDIMRAAPNLPIPLAKKLVTFVEGIRLVGDSKGSGNSTVPKFPTHTLATIAKILEQCDQESNIVDVLARSYPWIHSNLPENAIDPSLRSVLKSVVKTFVGNEKNGGDSKLYSFPVLNEDGDSIKWSKDEISKLNTMTVDVGGGVHMSSTGGKLGGLNRTDEENALKRLVHLQSHADVLLGMYQDHSVGCDLLLIGEKGCGKSVLTKEFAKTIGHSPILFSMYKDMTARDLLQRRATDEAGNTFWEPSPVVDAAINGRLVILDGLDRLSPDTLSALQRLGKCSCNYCSNNSL